MSQQDPITMVIHVKLRPTAAMPEMVELSSGARMPGIALREFNLQIHHVDRFAAWGIIVDDEYQAVTRPHPETGEPAPILVAVTQGTMESWEQLDSADILALEGEGVSAQLVRKYRLISHQRSLWSSKARDSRSWLS